MTPSIIFDFDGTIGETIPLALHALRKAYESMSLKPPSAELLTANFGPCELGLLRRLSPDLGDELYARYIDEYKRSHAEFSPAPFPGIRDLLRDLKSHGIPTAIVTGKSMDSAEISLEFYDLKDSFDIVEAGGLQGSIKPEKIEKILNIWGAQPQNTYYIGDSVMDIDDSRKAGVIPLSAAWSELADIDALARKNPEEIFRSVDGFAFWLHERGFLPRLA